MMAQNNDRMDMMQKVKVAVAGVLLVGAGGYLAWQLLGGTPEDLANNRGYKCAACGYDFAYTVKSGDIEPLKCPKCGAMAAYEAEKCYWTKGPDGTYIAKTEPTLVLLKTRIDPTSTEKTYCPDCGHEVVGHNPMPSPEQMREARER